MFTSTITNYNFLSFAFSAVQVVMWVRFVNIWIHVIRVPDQDVKMVVFVKLTIRMQCHRSNVDVQSDLQLHCAKSRSGMHAIRDHVKTLDHAIWSHFRNMYAHVRKDILVSYLAYYQCQYNCHYVRETITQLFNLIHP